MLGSFLNGTKMEDEFARGGLPPAKKDGHTNVHKGRRLTPDEKRKLDALELHGPDGKIVKRGVGRPKKAEPEKQKPVPFNLSDRLFAAFRKRAKQRGFKSWQEWLRSLGENDASDLLSDAN
jgi:hypothetical protein